MIRRIFSHFALCLLLIVSFAQISFAGDFKVGDKVEVQWKGTWYPAQVLGVKKGEWKIHYDGYESSWDEWVKANRIRVRKEAAAATPAAAAPAARSAAPQSAPKGGPRFTFANPNSKYRKIDRTGQTVNADLWKQATPEIGVGNVIFSSAEMPVNKEELYHDVGTTFNFKNLEVFTCRCYWPGKRKELIAYIEKKYPAYKFCQVRVFMSRIHPDKGTETDEFIQKTDAESLEWDQTRQDFLPENDFEKYPLADLESDVMPKGDYAIRVYVFLRFNTGNSEYRSSWEGNAWVTREVPFQTDILICYGEAHVIK